ncbi:MAG TPA: metalloregulator ArsR/SmtB family transcription factor [Ignavibacteriaceae bacterium]|nr:metalloregulator ArsR/SmtB family transcription factor [Ignavibacteriaceae bacterium]
MQDATNIFKTLSDKNRLRILKMLQSKPLCGCEIVSILNLSASTVSQHLTILKENGFIIEQKDSKWTNYSVNHNPADKRVLAILTSLDFWIGDLEKVDEDKKKLKTVDRFTLKNN